MAMELRVSAVEDLLPGRIRFLQLFSDDDGDGFGVGFGEDSVRCFLGEALWRSVCLLFWFAGGLFMWRSFGFAQLRAVSMNRVRLLFLPLSVAAEWIAAPVGFLFRVGAFVAGRGSCDGLSLLSLLCFFFLVVVGRGGLAGAGEVLWASRLMGAGGVGADSKMPTAVPLYRGSLAVYQGLESALRVGEVLNGGQKFRSLVWCTADL